MSIRNIFLFTGCLFILTGCAQKELTPQTAIAEKTASKEMLLYPQNVNFLAQNITPQSVAQDDFTYRYYSPWFRTHVSSKKDDALWANRSYGLKNRYYGENLQLIDGDEIDAIINATNIESYASINAHAIMIQNAQMRNLPTDKPFFKKTTLPGEGYPFDYLQTSRIHVAEPIIISHYSKDGAWAFIESSFASGWLPVESFVLVDAKARTEFLSTVKIAITKDNVPLYNGKQRFITYAKVGAILPISSEDDDFFYAYMYTRDAAFNAQKLELRIPKSFAQTVPLSFNKENLSQIGDALLGEKYGWGGFLANRDCSAMTRDFLSPFGIWIPRNSAAQKSFGEYVSLKDLTPKEKEAMILKNGIAFLSLIYLKGHIMLYAGEFEGKALVMQNIWGVRTMEDGKEGRNVIGKAIVSDLYVGANQENVPEKGLLINRVEGIMIKPANSKSNNLVSKYPSVKTIKDNTVFFMDGSSLPYDDKKVKTFDQKLENTDIEDMFTQKYPAFAPISDPTLNDDPGRFRNDAFLKKLYGSSKSEIEKNLTTVNWLPNHGGVKLKFNKNENASAQLQKVSDELDRLPEEYMKYLKKVDGTYYYRKIAKTERLSAHSYGIAIDLDTHYSRYWQWDKTHNFHNEFPKEIVDIFEKHGFIWGGRWYHYDTMHFEYRPELFESID
ncbi:SH3 domain-containing protein [Sulfurospirillum multivorans]|uniref:Peptidase n=2 Tax=Sulfurospirillum multivorans TaxID=66821 RepID=A0AA86AMJ3_SULMK|nr:SH3 domain-containing protein [Sulfurospirillum multivorans]AHJ13284.1 putative peptidase [Sulfurospirillum multivorans DSM 12446]QEH06774.1 putative peptidase [Sulfurospirillum multivorans]